jgi:NAD-dependent deacetylase
VTLPDGFGGQESLAVTNDVADPVERAASLLRNARHAVALTGAGSSTRSGIADFRTPGTGMWERYDPVKVASIDTFRTQPELFFRWIASLVGALAKAEPNPAHDALAAMEAKGILRAVITQNIDGLHQRAGSRQVLELHGNVRTATCIGCRLGAPTDGMIERFMECGQLPHCGRCGGLMKPDVVLFGEQLPSGTIDAALDHARRADAMLVAGSSLEVAPASHLPLTVVEHGGGVIIVNLAPTFADRIAEVVLRCDVAEALPKIAAACA